MQGGLTRSMMTSSINVASQHWRALTGHFPRIAHDSTRFANTPSGIGPVVSAKKHVRYTSSTANRLANRLRYSARLHVISGKSSSHVSRHAFGTSWECNGCEFTRSNSTIAEGGTSTELTELTVLVPAGVRLGQSTLDIDFGDGRPVCITIPQRALPGDTLIVRRKRIDEVIDADVIWREQSFRNACLEPFPKVENSATSHNRMTVQRAYDDLTAAVRAAGGSVSDKLERAICPPLNIPGLIAKFPIGEGEELCRIPDSLHISEATIKSSIPSIAHKVMQFENTTAEQRAEIAQAVLLAILLSDAEESTDTSRTSLSYSGCSAAGSAQVDPSIWAVWECYAASLLRDDFSNHPYMRAVVDPHALWHHLQPSPEADLVVDQARCMIATHQAVLEAMSAVFIGNITMHKLCHARLCMLSRAFRALHTDTPSLVPVIDLFNHTWLGQEGAKWQWDEESRAMVVYATRQHRKGEEICFSYGLKSNQLLYRNHGFTQPPEVEPLWSYMVHPNRCLPIYEKFLPHLSEGRQWPYVVLNTKHVDDSFSVVLRFVVTNGKNAVQFLHLLCARCIIPYEKDDSLRPAIEALARAREKDKSSAAWWNELREADVKLAGEDRTRIKMCEYLCLLGHLEAVHVFYGWYPEGDCLRGCVATRSLLVNTFRALKETGQLPE